MFKKLRETQKKLGAILEKNSEYIETFGNDTEVLNKINTSSFLYDCSYWGLIKLSGDDRIRYLHNQSTNDFNILKTGEGCETVFITSTGRTIDLASAILTEDSILILVSPKRRQYLMEWLDRFIFPMDKVELNDISQQYAIFSLSGEDSDKLIEKLGFNSILNHPEYSHQSFIWKNLDIRVITASGLKNKGFTFILPIENSEKFWLYLTEIGAIPIGKNIWQTLTILQGKPTPDHELTEEYNPLEAGLWHTISFDKGCYIGQETHRSFKYL